MSPRIERWLGLYAPTALLIVVGLRVSPFTIDDAYISFRYAENLANGNGLVYNVGERVEGYTNFLWTVLLALLHALGAPTPIAAKALGLAFASLSLVPLRRIALWMRPSTNVPCLATWLLASSFPFAAYSVLGLEAAMFSCLTLWGTWHFLLESAEPSEGVWTPRSRWPWSGLIFGFAALTRPEAPLFIGLLTLWLGRKSVSRKSLFRLALFGAIVALHIAFRRSYYGTWLPNTLAAKTGDWATQARGGISYVGRYFLHAGPLWAMGIFSIAASFLGPRRAGSGLNEGLAVASVALLFIAYVIVVGGDWMPFFRFLAPMEPFLFLLVDDAVRGAAARPERSTRALVAVAFAGGALFRVNEHEKARFAILAQEKVFWDTAAGGAAEWLVAHGEPGAIAIADIGYVGYRTGYPVVDMLGLLSPEIAAIEGGYTRKQGPAYAAFVFGKSPRYFLIISADHACRSPSVPSSRAAFVDPRFRRGYKLAHTVKLGSGHAWCIFERQISEAGPTGTRD